MERGHVQNVRRTTKAAVSPLLIALALVSTGAVSRAAGAAPSSFLASGFRPSALPAPAQARAPARAPARTPPAQARQLPAPVRFRESEGRGLIVRTWVNDSGPYDFAIDTGAGATIISRRVAAEARVPVSTAASVRLSGISGRRGASAREATVRSFALGDAGNVLPSRGLVIVADSLPEDLDGVLDPTECFQPLGYVIDFPAETLSAFDPRRTPLRRADGVAGGAIVPWLSEGGSRRPFVMLGEGRRALVDTGSGFGLAVTEQSARALGIRLGRGREREGVTDLGRGQVEAQRIDPATVHIAELALRGVPTDLLYGASASAPVLLGRDALRPFALTFDPLSRLIRFAPPFEDRQ